MLEIESSKQSSEHNFFPLPELRNSENVEFKLIGKLWMSFFINLSVIKLSKVWILLLRFLTGGNLVDIYGVLIFHSHKILC